MYFDPIEEHVPSEYFIKLAVDPWERHEAAALRRGVFCREQRIFVADDRDPIDEIAMPLVAVACIAGQPAQVVGTVRIHEAQPRLWFGSRLAVHPLFRRVHGIGTSLIQLAVRTAHARGCDRFLAHVQSQNALLFQKLHWRALEEIDLRGRPHHLMEADLAHYPPLYKSEIGFVLLGKAA